MSNHHPTLAFFASLAIFAVALPSAIGQDPFADSAPEVPAAAVQVEADASEVAFPSDHLTITEWVRPASTNQFQAKVIVPTMGGGAKSVPNASVTLMGQQGNVYRGFSDQKGNVLIPNVKPGVYAMTTRARGLFACYAMHVLRRTSGDEGLFPVMAEISCATISAREFEATILPHFTENYDRDVLKINEPKVKEIVGHVRGNEKYNVMQTDDGLVGYVYAATERGEDQDGGDHTNRLDPAVGMHIFLMMNGLRMGEDITDEDGRFDFANLQFGVYSLLAVGPDGIGAVGFELVGQRELTAMADPLNNVGERFVMENGAQGTDGEFAFQVIPVTANELRNIVSESLPDELPLLDEFGNPIGTPIGSPMAGGFPGSPPGGGGAVGGPGGGTGGGGAGGGGAGAGIGGLAAIGAIAAAAAASTGGGGGGIGFAAPAPASPDMVTQ